MTDSVNGENVTPEGEPQETAAPQPGEQPGSFGEAAAEMANETELDGGEPDGLDTPPASATRPPEDDELTVTKMALAEMTADAQRVQAEYANYRKRVDRDRELIRENATFAALAPIIEVLDTIERAREHGELEGGFKAVAEQLERVVANQGLTRFGEPGDPFDPTLHEALSHIGQDPEVAVTTCQHIAKVGYRIGDRVVRVAQVLVVDPVDN